MKKCFTYVFASLLVLCSYAQMESYVWVMPDSIGLDFTTDPPTQFKTSLEGDEACASIADKNGNLLFYTNGETVYNKNHQVMFNGSALVGSETTSQTIIAKQPGDNELYYIFCTDGQNDGSGIRYSIVDMSLDNGLGAIVDTEKNKILHAITTERMTAVRHTNNVDVWIITQSFTEFRNYLLTCDGLNFVSVDSPLLETQSTTDSNSHTIGQMKVSHLGDKLAVTITDEDKLPNAQDSGRVEIYNFDATTGIVDSGWSFKMMAPYGLEFSPSSRFLYVSNQYFDGSNHSYIFQYDLSETERDSILKNYETIEKFEIASKTSMQLAPDGNIYVCVYSGSLAFIDEPDEKGIKCLYNFPGIVFNIEGADTIRAGLPQMIAAPRKETYYICENDTFTVNGNDYTEAGTYYDTVFSASGCDSIIDYFDLIVRDIPQLDSIPDQMNCDSVALPEITGVNLAGGELYYTNKKGTGLSYSPGTYVNDIRGTYYAFSVNENNCKSYVPFNILECEGPFPNIITANEDGVNDVFRLKLAEPERYDLYVYNRWGKLIYSQNSYTNDWNPKNLEAGVYFYRVVHQVKQEEFKGQLQIVK